MPPPEVPGGDPPRPDVFPRGIVERIRKGETLHDRLFLLAALLFLLLPLVMGRFGIGFLTEILTWGILAIAYDLLYGYCGLLSLGHSVFFGLGAYGLALTIADLGWPVGLALLWGVAVSAAGAWLIGIFAVRVRGHGFIIVTIIAASIIFLLALRFKGLTGGDDGRPFQVAPISLGFFQLRLEDLLHRYYLVLAFALGVYGFARRLILSPLGRAFELVRENEDRASFIGYDVRRLKLTAFILSGAASGVAGALYALTSRYAGAEFINWLIAAETLVWTLFGGAGTLFGPVLGTGVLLVVKDYLNTASPFYYPIFLGAVIILVVTFAPRGVVGLLLGRARPHAG